MKRILHIIRDFGQNNGGNAISLRNRKFLKSLFADNYFSYSVCNKLGRQRISLLTGALKGCVGGLTRHDINNILQIIYDNKITLCFIDNSNLGIIARVISLKCPNVEVITFFHNCEKALIKQTYKGCKRYIYTLLSHINEKYACKYSSKIICLNNRDAIDIQQEYDRQIEIQIPISLPDRFVPINRIKVEDVILFVGSYFKPNIDGIMWFIMNVLPAIPYKLWIVGHGMQQLIDNNNVCRERIQVFSNVKDLSPFYQAAKCVIMPIFSGSGMKVKTAEALMFGKYILSTPEGLEGYDIPQSGYVECKTAEDFINQLQYIDSSKQFIQANRCQYLAKYSDSVIYNSFMDIFKSH